jgi:AcrR family transcriptional regulator
MDAIEILAEANSTKAQHIIRAAREAFLDTGYGETTMDQVARAAGVSKATLYAHFTNKQALFGAVIAEECNRTASALFDPGIDNTDVRRVLARLGRNFCDMVLDPVKLSGYRVVVAEAGRFPELGEAFYRAGPARTISSLAEYLERMNALGVLDVPHARLAASQFLGMIKADHYMRRLFGIADGPGDPSPADAVDAAVEVFLRAYGTAR